MQRNSKFSIYSTRMTPYPGHNRFRPRPLWIAIALCLFAMGGPGCNDPNASNQDVQSFGKGYEDGKRDGLDSWSDMHSGWTWLWTKSEVYRQDYHRGWADGRNLRTLMDRQKNLER